MDLKRLTRVISDRWGVVLIGALIGLGGALLWLAFGSTGETVFQATAAIRFDPAEGQTTQQVADELNIQRDLATQLGEDILEDDPTAQIAIDLGTQQLQFTRQGATQAEAEQNAVELRNTYQQTNREDLDARFQDLQDEAIALDTEIAELQPELSADDVQLLADQTRLDTAIAAVNERLLGMVLDEAAARTAEDQAALATERSRLETELVELQTERQTLGAPPVNELSTEDALRLAALQARKDSLTAEYQRLYLQSIGVGGRGIELQPRSDNFESEPIDPILVAGLGLLGGAAVAILGLMMISRTRRIVWMPEDLDVPVLGYVPARPLEVRGNEAWYDTAEPGPRKTAVQALRSAVQAYAHSSGSTIALTGHNISSADVQALAADLAGSMATAGDSVLLIDANFESRSALGEYRVAGMALAEVLRLQPEAPDFTKQVNAAVEQAYVIRPGLAVIPSGPPPGSPADALAGRQFRSLITAAEEKYDTTILVVDDFDTPSSQVAMQRVRHGILVTTPGATTETEINGLLDDAERLRISVVGTVFLGRRGRLSGLFRRPEPEQSQPTRERAPQSVEAEEPAKAQTPMNRLSNYSIPDERRSAAVQRSPLGELATSFGLATGDEAQVGGLGNELLDAMSGVSSEHAYEAVADFVVSRAEDMVTARYGYGDLLEALIHDVSEFGFLSLRPVRSHRTVGSWLTEEVEREVEWQSGSEVVGQMERLLSGDQPGVGVDDWLDREFFTRHLERTEGEPEVWHLVSPEHHVSLLLPARRLNAEKLEAVVTEVVSGGIDELERKRKAAVTRADLETAAEYEQQIWDVRAFEKSLRDVLYGSKGSGKRVKSVAWGPNWSDGTRANLAVFQTHGLLPFEVLSEEEISALLATA